MDARREEAWVILATRIPKALHRRMRIHCVLQDQSVQSFVITALEEELRGKPARVIRQTGT